jgi:hypothetical protein
MKKTKIKNAHHSPPKGYPKKKTQYADPAHYKYPIDTEAHVHAAMSYLARPKNARQYSPEQLAAMHARIGRAAKKFGIGRG